MNNKRITLLLTATIDPKGIVFLKRNDPLVREQDYINALSKWLETVHIPIVFCENSNYRSNKIINLIKNYSNKEIEILQFAGQNFPKELGKGYGELLIIEYAIQNSILIEHSDYVIKITGRYYIKNIQKIMRALLNDKNFYVMVDLKRNLTWADSRAFAFKPSFINNYLSKFQDLINDSEGFYLEHALARAVLRAISDGYKWMPLPLKPFIIGHAGTLDAPYSASMVHWVLSEVIHYIKNYLNRKY